MFSVYCNNDIHSKKKKITVTNGQYKFPVTPWVGSLRVGQKKSASVMPALQGLADSAPGGRYCTGSLYFFSMD